MAHSRKISTMFIFLLAFLTFFVLPPDVVAATPSVNVAYIDSLSVISGGSFPTTTTGPTGSFNSFSFFPLPVASVSSAALGPGGICGQAGCDTVLLNVASPGIACNTGVLTVQQKAGLVNFLASGHKLIIYDSECAPQDYSWLPYPFTTNNPGAQGEHQLR
jgi:hypothetical protein